MDLVDILRSTFIWSALIWSTSIGSAFIGSTSIWEDTFMTDPIGNKMIQARDLASILRNISDVMTEHKDELCQLDAQMGDGDLGITMSRGWLAAAETAAAETAAAETATAESALADTTAAESAAAGVATAVPAGARGGVDLGKLLVKSGMKMAAAAPSTMGTLMSSGLIEAGKRLVGQTELAGEGVATFLEGFCQGMIKRGRCSPGDRTVLDSIWPAARVAEQLKDQSNLADAAVFIRDAAKAGLESTRDMEPKFGRAAVLATRTKGLVDQGALAGYLMVDAICTWLLGDHSTSL